MRRLRVVTFKVDDPISPTTFNINKSVTFDIDPTQIDELKPLIILDESI